jgi:hypothetical protein
MGRSQQSRRNNGSIFNRDDLIKNFIYFHSFFFFFNTYYCFSLETIQENKLGEFCDFSTMAISSEVDDFISKLLEVRLISFY